MTIWRLISKEIYYRRAAFILGLLSVSAAMTVWVGSIVLLQANDLATQRILDARERATSAEMTQLENDYRRIMRDLGYNVMILPGDQDLARLRAAGHPDTTMPYSYVDRLAQGGVDTLNHLLPVLQQRTTWPERNLEIILSGTPGQVPISHQTHFLTADGTAYRNPLMPSIAPGELVVGFNIARSLGIKPGDAVELLGDTFRIRAVNASEGTSDDIAVWCDLSWMQRKLGLQDQINLILALECVCTAEALGLISAEVGALLPDVQVIEFSSKVKARALARARAGEAHRRSIAAERQHRAEIAAAYQRFSAVMIPLAIAGAVVWLVFLFFGNARDRAGEIAILRAVGVSEQIILTALLLKSLLIGVLGAVFGFAAGNLLGAAWGGTLSLPDLLTLLDLRLLASCLIAAPALCILAAWLPAMLAMRKHPADILCQI